MNHSFDGQWFAQGSATYIHACLLINDATYQLIVDGELKLEGEIDSLVISDRLGNIQRKITLDDGSVFATNDNDNIDQLLVQRANGNSLIHRFESSLKWAVVAIIITVATTFSFFRWGLPAISSYIAHSFPQQTGVLIGEQSLEFLDKIFFDPTELAEEQREQIINTLQQDVFEKINVDETFEYQIHFRAWGENDTKIANALALPSGDIILTDRFVELASNSDEITAVVLHEIGHIEHRHTLEMITQSTLIAAIFAVFTGDAGVVADMGIGLGSMLVTSGYSRRIENEADIYAFDQMLYLGIDPSAFGSILQKINNDIPQFSNDQDNEESINAQTGGLTEYFETHPTTQDRIDAVARYSDCFRKGLTVCRDD